MVGIVGVRQPQSSASALHEFSLAFTPRHDCREIVAKAVSDDPDGVARFTDARRRFAEMHFAAFVAAPAGEWCWHYKPPLTAITSSGVRQSACAGAAGGTMMRADCAARAVERATAAASA